MNRLEREARDHPADEEQNPPAERANPLLKEWTNEDQEDHVEDDVKQVRMEEHHRDVR